MTHSREEQLRKAIEIADEECALYERDGINTWRMAERILALSQPEPTAAPLAQVGVVSEAKGIVPKDAIYISKEHFNRLCQFAAKHKYGRCDCFDAAPPAAPAEVTGLELTIQTIIDRWDDGKNNYRGRAMIGQLKEALAATAKKEK